MSAPLDNIPLFSSIEVDLPAWFAVPTKNYGNPKKPVWFALANPMTTSRNISTRKQEKSIDIKRRVIDAPKLEVNEWDNRNLTIDHFAPKDQARIEKMEQHPNKTFSNYPVLERGRPEELEKNKVYNRHHKHQTKEQKYGRTFLDRVEETLRGKPIEDGDGSVYPSPSSSRTPSRLSSLASSLRSSAPSSSSSSASSDSRGGSRVFGRPIKRKVVIEEDSDSDEGSGSASDEEESKSSKSKSSSRSSKSFTITVPRKKPSVSRGKPPLKRKEPNPAITQKALERANKKRAKEEAMEAKRQAKQEAKEAKDKAKADRPKGKSKGAKPTSSQGDAPLVQQARGRAPKYATKTEAYQAKLEKNREWKERAKAKKAQAKADAEKPSTPEGEGIKLTTTELPVEKKKRGRPKKVIMP